MFFRLYVRFFPEYSFIFYAFGGHFLFNGIFAKKEIPFCKKMSSYQVIMTNLPPTFCSFGICLEKNVLRHFGGAVSFCVQHIQGGRKCAMPNCENQTVLSCYNSEHAVNALFPKDSYYQFTDAGL